ncbi:MAG: hypothetical protein V4718_04340 [Pseudomonadota bacterium]
MIVVGIDPGLTGACAVVSHRGLLSVFDIPKMKIPGVGPTALVQNKIDGRNLCRLLLAKCPTDESIQVCIEAVGVMGGANNAVQTQGSLMRSLGALETVIECLNWELEYVNSQKWKRFYGLIDSNLNDRQRKAKAMESARRLYPGSEFLNRAKDHNRGEAILIAHWRLRVAA